MSEQSTHQLEIDLSEAVKKDDIEKIKQLLTNPNIDVNYKVIFFYYFFTTFQIKIRFMEFKAK